MTLNGAIKQLHELRAAEDMPFYYRPAIAEVINVLLMDAQEVKHGRWRLTRDGQMVYKVCSVCAERMPLNQWRQEWESPFCPSCGAKMCTEEGEKE